MNINKTFLTIKRYHRKVSLCELTAVRYNLIRANHNKNVYISPSFKDAFPLPPLTYSEDNSFSGSAETNCIPEVGGTPDVVLKKIATHFIQDCIDKMMKSVCFNILAPGNVPDFYATTLNLNIMQATSSVVDRKSFLIKYPILHFDTMQALSFFINRSVLSDIYSENKPRFRSAYGMISYALIQFNKVMLSIHDHFVKNTDDLLAKATRNQISTNMESIKENCSTSRTSKGLFFLIPLLQFFNNTYTHQSESRIDLADGLDNYNSMVSKWKDKYDIDNLKSFYGVPHALSDKIFDYTEGPITFPIINALVKGFEDGADAFSETLLETAFDREGL